MITCINTGLTARCDTLLFETIKLFLNVVLRTVWICF